MNKSEDLGKTCLVCFLAFIILLLQYLVNSIYQVDGLKWGLFRIE